MATTSPVRIQSLDVIRGVSVMGIFSVNVIGMAMIQSAYFYPPDFGFEHWYDKLVWAFNSVLIDGRWRSLFSLLFGASTIVVCEAAVAAGKASWKVHYPRMIVLLIFGLAHYYLLWWGDILANYAMVGMVAWLFWRLPGKWQLLLGIAVLLFVNVKDLSEFLPQMAKVEHGLSAGATPEERAKVEKMLAPDPELPARIAKDTAEHSSIPAHVVAATQKPAVWRPFQGVIGYGIETLGLMLIGMWAFKSGFLTGAWRRKSYVIAAIVMLGVNLAVQIPGAYLAWHADFAPQVFFPWLQLYVNPTHVLGALGFAAIIILLMGHGEMTRRFGAVGRAAFTNYLGSTIIGTLVFYGTFGGLYGEVSRGEAWLLVPVVWAVMLLWSKWWLDRYRYGPFEWVWRSLSRWEMQPMRKRPPSPEISPAAA